MNKKYLFVLKILLLICILIILFEISWFFYHEYKKNHNILYLDNINSYEYKNDSYVTVGVNNNNEKKINKAKVTKYNSKYEKIWEKLFNLGYNSEFLGVSVDGNNNIISVGYYEKDKVESNKGVTTAVIVKYDNDGNILFQKDLQLMGNSKFNSILVVDDGYIVSGQSIYEDKTLGSQQGGAVLVKYNKQGRVLWKTNYGSSKNASYNDLVMVGDNIYAVGKDAIGTGIISIYTMDGDRVDTFSYDSLDSNGFVSAVNISDNIYVIGTKVNSDFDTDGIIVKYDLDCDIVDDTVYSGRGFLSFDKIIKDNNDDLVVVGNMSVYNKKASNKKNKVYDYFGIIGKYKANLEKVEVLEYGDSTEDFFTDVNIVNGNYLVVGYSCYEKEGYLSKFITYSDALKVLEVK